MVLTAGHAQEGPSHPPQTQGFPISLERKSCTALQNLLLEDSSDAEINIGVWVEKAFRLIAHASSFNGA